MTAGAPRVVTVIVTYNAEPWLERCLSSCRASTVPLHVVVVDNASADATRQIARSHAVELLEQPQNRGFGRANNIGLARSRQLGAAWHLLLNQDAFLRPDTVATLLEVGETRPELGVLSPLHLAANAEDLDGPFQDHLAAGAPHYLSDLRGSRVKPVYAVPFVNAAAWLVRDRCLQEVGGFDPLFFLYGEDDDWCLRAARHGWTIGIVPAAEMIHARGGESGDATRMRRIGPRANRIYLRHVLALKRPERSFARSFAGATLETLTRGARLALALQGREAIAAVRGYLRALRRLPRIRRHRLRSLQPGPHWLDGDG